MILLFFLSLCVPRPSSGESCIRYKRYFDELSYCSDPLYWSRYSLSTAILRNLTRMENMSMSDYGIIRDKVYNNTELLHDTGVNQKHLNDCLGMAQRIACHRNLPRCFEGGSRPLCRSLCNEFHRRCTVDGYNFITRNPALGETYDLFTCDGLATQHCSRGSPRALTNVLSVLLTTTSTFWILRLALRGNKL